MLIYRGLGQMSSIPLFVYVNKKKAACAAMKDQYEVKVMNQREVAERIRPSHAR